MKRFAAAVLLLLVGCATSDGPPRAEPGPSFHQDVAWSPDGRRIAYSEFRRNADGAGGVWSVYVSRADGQGRHLIAHNAQFVTWAPDGQRIAFSANVSGDWDLHIARTSGAASSQAVAAHAGRDTHPAWSPDGRSIAFISQRGGAANLHLLDVASGETRQLTNTAATEDNPAWSPDGATIVFYRRDEQAHDQLYALDVESGVERTLTSDAAWHIYPSFAPDGDVLYARRTESNAPSQLTRLSLGAQPIVDRPAFFGRYSPDGRRIAFISGEFPSSTIWIAPADNPSRAIAVVPGE